MNDTFPVFDTEFIETEVYICDPNKNTACNKNGCFLNDGECYLTTKKEHAMILEGEVLTFDNHMKLLINYLRRCVKQ